MFLSRSHFNKDNNLKIDILFKNKKFTILKMIDKELIKILVNISVLLELKGENPFKSRAYTNAAEIIQSKQIDVHEAVKNNTISNIKGFGPALQKKITDYVLNGKMSYYEKLKEEIPESLIELTKISNLGTKKAKMLFENLNVKSLDDLEKACKENKLIALKGFSTGTQEDILKSILQKKNWVANSSEL